MIDLHMHSTFSDGKDDITTLIENVKNAGISVFSVTDHDTALSARTILSNDSLKNKIVDNGLSYVSGVEWSCIFGKYKMHLLAYDFDPFNPEVLRLEKQIEILLDGKRRAREEYIENNGCKLSKESWDYIKSKDNVRRLDYANCLVNDGYFKDVDDACKNFLNKHKYQGTDRLDAVDVITTMTNLGAKVVWAHSLHGLNEKPITFEEVEIVAGELKQFGLAGLECFYSLYSKEEIDELLAITDRLGLLVTCGSDYHGKNKAVQLAEFSSDGSEVDKSKVTILKHLKNILKG